MIVLTGCDGKNKKMSLFGKTRRRMFDARWSMVGFAMKICKDRWKQPEAPIIDNDLFLRPDPSAVPNK